MLALEIRGAIVEDIFHSIDISPVLGEPRRFPAETGDINVRVEPTNGASFNVQRFEINQSITISDPLESTLRLGLEPRLTREGYNTKVLAELLNAKPREIKAFLRGQLPAGRTQELQTELLAVGIPV